MSPRIVVEFLVLSALWGSSFLFMHLSLPGFGPLPAATARVAGASLFLLPILYWSGQIKLLRKHWKAVLIVGAFNSAIPFAMYSFALLTLNTGLAGIINATTPMFGALVAWIWLKDRPDGSRIIGLIIGFTGVALLASQKASFQAGPSGIASFWAVLACLLACLCYGIAASYAKRFLGGIPPLVAATGSQIGATLLLALPALWLRPLEMPGTVAWVAVGVSAILCTGVAYILYFRIIEAAGPARALAVPFVVPVFAVFYGALFLDEQITVWMVVCGAVIILGTALSTGLLRLPLGDRQRPLR